MPLRDHFRPPLSESRHWHAFHNAWATYLASDLNARLPAGWFAEPNVQFGLEIDVAAFEEGGGAGAPAEWSPSPPVRTVPFALATDVVEVVVYRSEGGPELAGAIELVSPANKDRPGAREAFVAKCEGYLARGIGLVIVDVVTTRSADMHRELMKRLGTPIPGEPATLYGAAYRVLERETGHELEVWEERLALGQPLPGLPLWLRGGPVMQVALETTYERTCSEQRVPVV